ncbi:MAG: DUF4194 domain-containing protein [Terrimicrobiaceae bacterium]|nr:DUF4194 domain-containing protein [Terrimicrobiaceae bacterium]
MNPELPNLESSAEPALSGIVIPLLKGVVYQESDSALWGQLLGLEARVRDYVGVLNLELVLDEAEGYAFLRSREADPESESASVTDTSAPRLYPRRPLSFPVSLLLALLRKKLAEFDASGGDTRLVLTREEITEMLRLFLPAQANEVRITDQIETHLNKIAELGFVRKLKIQTGALQPAAYEVRRILKAFVDAQWLADFDARLDSYRRQFEIPVEEPNDD